MPAAPGTAQWSSRFAFIMAAVGSSVGLGNLWRFSSEAGQSGGGAFILVYLLAVVLVCIPVLMSEYLVGRAGSSANAVDSVAEIAIQSRVTKNWGVLSWVGMIAGFLIVTFYCVVAAWVVRYIFKFLGNDFAGLEPDQVAGIFTNFIGTPIQVLPWFLLFALITIWLVSRGVNRGIELAAKVLMPLFFILLTSLAVFALVTNIETGGTSAALSFLYAPDFSKINGDVANAALGQAFFSVGVGSAIMITYGSYLPQDISIPKASVIVGLTDTAVALIAGLAIFPIVFAFGLEANAGAGLFFITLPNAFASMGAIGPIVGAAFFFLAFFAAITSSVSLLEPSVAFASERFKMSKAKAAWVMGALMIAVGLISVFGVTSDGDTYALDAIDTFTGQVMLPLAGLLIVIFVGWRLDKAIIAEEFAGSEGLGNVLIVLTRFVAPLFVFIVLVSSIYTSYFAG
ncbi:sodium-dependent transporter [uncultured Algimonas sp.]|uniref:sodium-dependent transporter n=1 Tax=uncultured Algimonas sp. TaxID=1547920 RepID=UPI00261BD4E3|nr:sodium-dependent transporter [uncultured Algimonas sp.]